MINGRTILKTYGNAIDEKGCINHTWCYIRVGYNPVSGRVEELDRSSGWEWKGDNWYR